MDDKVSTYTNATGAALLTGGLSAAASLPLVDSFYSFWPKVSSGCIWPPVDTLLAIPLAGILGAGTAATYVLYQAYHVDTALRCARCSSMTVATILFWHLLVPLSPLNQFSERFAETLPMYLLLAPPVALLLRWQHRTSRRLQQLRAVPMTK